MDISLRKAAESDIPKLIELEEKVSGSLTYSPALTKESWDKLLAAGPVYFIDVEGNPVGNTSYEVHDDRVYISGLVVIPEFQNKGIGRIALNRLLEEIGPRTRIDMVTHPDNTAALSLYRSFGFEIESRKENYYGDGEPRVVMVKK